MILYLRGENTVMVCDSHSLTAQVTKNWPGESVYTIETGKCHKSVFLLPLFLRINC